MTKRYGPWLPTRELAKKLGAKHYFTGQPCKNGHIEPRFTASFACMACAANKQHAENMSNEQLLRKREHWQEWYCKPSNRKAQIEKSLRALETKEGRERNRKNANRYYQENRDEVLKKERIRREYAHFIGQTEAEEMQS